MRCIPGTLGIAAIFALLPQAMAQPADAERGRDLAERWCTTCHIVAEDVPGGTIGPAFSAMIDLRGRSEAQLKGWLAAPHNPMPDFNLSEREIRDLVAYIATVNETW